LASGQSIIYSSSQELGGLRRDVRGPDGRLIATTFPLDGGPTQANPVWNFVDGSGGSPTDFTDRGGMLPFSSKFVLNRYDPIRIAIGTNYVYITNDRLIQQSAMPQLTSVGPVDNNDDPIRIGPVTALAYGTGSGANNPDAEAMVVGTQAAQLYFSDNVATTNLAVRPAYANAGGQAPTSVVFDGRTSRQFYVADGSDIGNGGTGGLWRTGDSGNSFDGNLNQQLNNLRITRPTAVEFIANNGVNALLAGGIRSDPNAQSPIAVGLSNNGGLVDTLQPFGNGLPNTMVNLLSYNPTVDVLAVSLWGRGIWTLYDLTSYFPTAYTLNYGLANNDSTPDAFYLSNGVYASRSLQKYGAGTLTINGTATYTGPTTVFGGTMVVNGDITSLSSLLVSSAGTLRGTGMVRNATIDGLIAPGNSIGTLGVLGTYTQNPGSTFQTQVNSAGQASQVIVGGTATLQGGTVAPQVQTGAYAPRTTYTILSTAGGLSGAFSSLSVNSPYQFLMPSLFYDTNNAYLTLTIGGFLSAAQNPVQAAVAGALDGSVLQATGDYATVLSTLATLNASQVQPILTSLSGMNYSGFSNSMVQTAQLFMSNFLNQAGGTNRNRNTIALAEACDVACDATEPAKWGAWGGGLGGLGTVGSGQSLGGVTYNLGGFAGGLDRRFSDTFLAGVAVGYTTGSQWVSGFTGQGFSNTVQAGVYGSYLQGPVYVDGIVGYAYTANQLNRSIIIPGLAGRTAVGQTGANQTYGQVESGYRVDVGTTADAFITPFARLQAYTGTQNAFTESGAQSLSLSVAAQTTNSLRSVLGAQLGGAMNLGWRDKLHAQLRLGWSHEYADTSRPVSASFVGAPTAPFTTYGATPSRDGAVVGLAASTALAQATSLYLSYEGNIAGQDSSHALTAGLRMTW
jgi:outer membrane autotransporter protein